MKPSKLTPIASDVLGLVKYVQALIAQGLDREAVLERLMEPANVGAQMIDRAVERRAAGEAYMGSSGTQDAHEPDFALVYVEDA